ncbi:MAG: hypothetical protein U0Q16_36775 [Bryobacteraceae bacterium]
MAITVELPKELEERFVAQARVRGISVGAYVQEHLEQTAPAETTTVALSAEEVDRLLDEACDVIPAGVPTLSDYAMSRESIYTREDEWNR